MEKDIAELKKQKRMLVSSPARALAFDKDGKVKVAFLFNRHIGLIELVEDSLVNESSCSYFT